MSATANDAPLASRLDAVDQEAGKARQQFAQQAGEEARRLTERFKAYEAVRTQVHDLFKPRFDALVQRIPGVEPVVERDAERGEVRLFVGHTDECPPTVTLTFTVSHDGRAERVILDYCLSVVPLFIEFEPRSRFETPVASFDSAGATKWMDDRIVDFLRIYRSIPMVEAYQKDRMVQDPVARVWFGKALAKATREFGGAKHYFASEDAAKEFDREPKRFVATAGGPS